MPTSSHEKLTTTARSMHYASCVSDTHTNVLNSFLLQPWADSSTWKLIKGTVRDHANNVAKYTAYLQQKNIEV